MTFNGDYVIKVTDPVVFPERFFVTVIKEDMGSIGMSDLTRKLFRYNDTGRLIAGALIKPSGITVLNRAMTYDRPDIGLGICVIMRHALTTSR